MKWLSTLGLMLPALFFGCTAQVEPPTAERAIEAKITVKAGVNEVWKAWTTSEGIKSFFAPDARVELRVDGPFQIYINPLAEAGMRGADEMRIIGFQEGRMLSFTWNAPPFLPEARKQRTVVIVRFAARGEDLTDVTLHHLGWGEGGEWDQAYDYFSRSWPGVLKNLKKRFDDGPIDWQPWLEQLKANAAKANAANANAAKANPAPKK